MKSNKYLTYTFFIIIFGLLILYPVNYVLNKFNIVNIITYKTDEPNLKTENNILTRTSNKIEKVKTSFENTVSNYFFFNDTFNTIDKNINKNLNKEIYNNILDKNYYPVGKNSDGEYIYRNNDHYILQNNLKDSELEERLNKQIAFFNSLNLDINLFIPYRFEYTNMNNNSIRNMNKYVEQFKENINSNINIKEFKVNTYEDYLKYFYKTDHHYNMYGAYESYKIICDMLDIVPKEINIISNDLNYRGSMARSSFLTDITDNFYTYETNIDDYTVTVNGKENSNYKPKTIKKNVNKFYDYYFNYYNSKYREVIYNFNNFNKKNLLILEDSYGWQIDELIASSYNKTFIYDIREFNKNEQLDLEQFIKENNIDQVLFLYEAGTVLFDQYNYGLKDKVI